jgi:hypothetical protein
MDAEGVDTTGDTTGIGNADRLTSVVAPSMAMALTLPPRPNPLGDGIVATDALVFGGVKWQVKGSNAARQRSIVMGKTIPLSSFKGKLRSRPCPVIPGPS